MAPTCTLVLVQFRNVCYHHHHHVSRRVAGIVVSALVMAGSNREGKGMSVGSEHYKGMYSKQPCSVKKRVGTVQNAGLCLYMCMKT